MYVFIKIRHPFLLWKHLNAIICFDKKNHVVFVDCENFKKEVQRNEKAIVVFFVSVFLSLSLVKPLSCIFTYASRTLYTLSIVFLPIHPSHYVFIHTPVYTVIRADSSPEDEKTGGGPNHGLSEFGKVRCKCIKVMAEIVVSRGQGGGGSMEVAVTVAMAMAAAAAAQQ